MEQTSLVKAKPLADRKLLVRAIADSFEKLDPRVMVKNPVMFVVEVGALLTTIELVHDTLRHVGQFGFGLQITLWLWFTVVFANFAETIAVGRGKAQAETFHKARAGTGAPPQNAQCLLAEVPRSQPRFRGIVVVVHG